MKNKTIILIVAVNLAILVLLAIFYPHLMISPGKPIEAHAELATDCFACHTPFIGSRPDKCIVCHKVEEIGLKTTKGLSIVKEKKNVVFHQELIEEDCVSCHSDHKGVQAFRPISQFTHELLESKLQEQCDSCHATPLDNMHQKSKGNCSECHSQDAWTPATLDHDEYFRFDRDHDTECETCHRDNDYANYTCYGCHEHSRSNIREEHLEEGIRDYEQCTECHRSGDEDEAERIWRSKIYNTRGLRTLDTEGYEGRSYKHREHDDDD
ncbi:cytochrome c3 family protein [Solemya velum gill symbiont]|uniref:cytochrome c3 family protein n=1 Tax=Solemya velum gill symbiont TaxID=2340 RepID=UPI000997AB72|nr:cytochrome c3 family protein [Solemya velum gill symbiont]OOZ43122.1 class III cytochrome C family protein [Solemya velum gill symbiont]OOZ43887.1 class III cytochrome C family protein [Solemya velum gill symbiont]OOZ47712.1 class III cytochrome C family protein [Solemya velum gill symbiont]OOZ48876.1 class III cytochrome C family protein [Solemya velum gill symbiont]OOZ52835.1 class III cytochrome C family protein [Solemya velum gill symbiont]